VSDLPLASIEAEQAVLGALLLRADAIDSIDWLNPDHFYREAHRTIYHTLKELAEVGKEADIILVSDVLKAGGELENVGGLSYLLSLVNSSGSARNVARYAEIVRDKAILRQLAANAAEIHAAAQEPNAAPQELAERAETAFLSILQPTPQEALTMYQAADLALEWQDNPQKGLPTGYAALDRIIGGLREEELIVIAGRPGMGKSALAENIAEHVAKQGPVLFCSLEMSARQIAARSLAYHRTNLSITDALGHFSELKLHIDPRSPLSLASLRMRARRHKRKHGLRLLVVDYLQLVTPPKSENRTQEVGALSRGMKSIAKEFGIPVVVVASLNRKLEERADKRPILSDLRESGDIESDADIVMMVYRDEEYHSDSTWKGLAEIIVRKHREGPTGTAVLVWRPEQTRFVDHDGPLPERTATENRRPSRGNFQDYKSKAAGE